MPTDRRSGRRYDNTSGFQRQVGARIEGMRSAVAIEGDAERTQICLQGIALQGRFRIHRQGERVQHGSGRVVHGDSRYLEGFDGIDSQGLAIRDEHGLAGCIREGKALRLEYFRKRLRRQVRQRERDLAGGAAEFRLPPAKPGAHPQFRISLQRHTRFRAV